MTASNQLFRNRRVANRRTVVPMRKSAANWRESASNPAPFRNTALHPEDSNAPVVNTVRTEFILENVYPSNLIDRGPREMILCRLIATRRESWL